MCQYTKTTYACNHGKPTSSKVKCKPAEENPCVVTQHEKLAFCDVCMQRRDEAREIAERRFGERSGLHFGWLNTYNREK